MISLGYFWSSTGVPVGMSEKKLSHVFARIVFSLRGMLLLEVFARAQQTLPSSVAGAETEVEFELRFQ